MGRVDGQAHRISTLLSRLNWLVPALSALVALPLCAALHVDPGVYVMSAGVLFAAGLGVERYVSSKNPGGDPLIVPRRPGLRAGLPWWMAAAIWLAVGAIV